MHKYVYMFDRYVEDDKCDAKHNDNEIISFNKLFILER